MAESKIEINRAPVMTLWAAVVAERLGYDEEAALTLGRAVTGKNAYAKGRRLGIYEESKDEEAEATKTLSREQEAQLTTVSLLGRQIPARKTEQGLRAATKGKPDNPGSVRRYLEKKFGEHLADARAAMEELAGAYPPNKLADEAYALYEQFRPDVPKSKKGWGAAGTLDLDLIRKLGRSGRR